MHFKKISDETTVACLASLRKCTRINIKLQSAPGVYVSDKIYLHNLMLMAQHTNENIHLIDPSDYKNCSVQSAVVHFKMSKCFTIKLKIKAVDFFFSFNFRAD